MDGIDRIAWYNKLWLYPLLIVAVSGQRAYEKVMLGRFICRVNGCGGKIAIRDERGVGYCREHDGSPVH